MTHVATLICAPERPALDRALAARAAAALPGAQAPAWLDAGIAVDLTFAFAGEDERATAARVRDALGAAPVDVVVQRAEGRRKRLLVADMDSTIIGQECIDELADIAGLKDRVADITERAMRGEIAFAPALRERVGLLRGLPAQVIEEVIRERVRITPGARTLVATMRAEGAYACLVSGGFTAFTRRIGKAVGFDEDRGNTLLVEGGRLTGEVAEPVLGRGAKLEALAALRDRLGLAAHETLAVGDGANDLAMIEAAGLGVAYHAKPAVAAAAHARIDHGDLTALLYAQGYRRREFAVV